VGGLSGTGVSNHLVVATDKDGRFSWPIPTGGGLVSLYVHRPGYALSTWMRWFDTRTAGDDIEMQLRKAPADPFLATLVDEDDRPIVGAKVRVEIQATSVEMKNQGGGISYATGYSYYHRSILEGSPLDSLVSGITDEHGKFSFPGFLAGSWLKLGVTTRDGRQMRVKMQRPGGGVFGLTVNSQGFVMADEGKSTRLMAFPAARVQGRVMTRLPGVSVAGLKVWYQASQPRPGGQDERNFGGVTRTDAQGRFTFDRLHEGTINIYAAENEHSLPWTYRAAHDVELKSGWTKTAIIELIRGVEVEGKVLSPVTGAPIKGAQIGVYGPFRPRSGAATLGATTDAQGIFRYRLPPGETYFYVMGHSPGRADRTVTIPEGVDRFEVPPIVPGYVLVTGGLIVDAAGRPIAGATVSCIGENGPLFDAPDAATDSNGAFQLLPSPNNTVAAGGAARLRVRLRDGSEHDVSAWPESDGSVTIRLEKPAKRS
jgi:hypothetical protein